MASSADADAFANSYSFLRKMLPRASSLAIVPMPRPTLESSQEVWLRHGRRQRETLGLTLEFLEIKDPSVGRVPRRRGRKTR